MSGIESPVEMSPEDRILQVEKNLGIFLDPENWQKIMRGKNSKVIENILKDLDIYMESADYLDNNNLREKIQLTINFYKKIKERIVESNRNKDLVDKVTNSYNITTAKELRENFQGIINTGTPYSSATSNDSAFNTLVNTANKTLVTLENQEYEALMLSLDQILSLKKPKVYTVDANNHLPENWTTNENASSGAQYAKIEIQIDPKYNTDEWRKTVYEQVKTANFPMENISVTPINASQQSVSLELEKKNAEYFAEKPEIPFLTNSGLDYSILSGSENYQNYIKPILGPKYKEEAIPGVWCAQFTAAEMSLVAPASNPGGNAWTQGPNMEIEGNLVRVPNVGMKTWGREQVAARAQGYPTYNENYTSMLQDSMHSIDSTFQKSSLPMLVGVHFLHTGATDRILAGEDVTGGRNSWNSHVLLAVPSSITVMSSGKTPQQILQENYEKQKNISQGTVDWNSPLLNDLTVIVDGKDQKYSAIKNTPLSGEVKIVGPMVHDEIKGIRNDFLAVQLAAYDMVGGEKKPLYTLVYSSQLNPEKFGKDEKIKREILPDTLSYTTLSSLGTPLSKAWSLHFERLGVTQQEQLLLQQFYANFFHLTDSTLTERTAIPKWKNKEEALQAAEKWKEEMKNNPTLSFTDYAAYPQLTTPESISEENIAIEIGAKGEIQSVNALKKKILADIGMDALPLSAQTPSVTEVLNTFIWRIAQSNKGSYFYQLLEEHQNILADSDVYFAQKGTIFYKKKDLETLKLGIEKASVKDEKQEVSKAKEMLEDLPIETLIKKYDFPFTLAQLEAITGGNTKTMRTLVLISLKERYKGEIKANEQNEEEEKREAASDAGWVEKALNYIPNKTPKLIRSAKPQLRNYANDTLSESMLINGSTGLLSMNVPKNFGKPELQLFVNRFKSLDGKAGINFTDQEKNYITLFEYILSPDEKRNFAEDLRIKMGTFSGNLEESIPTLLRRFMNDSPLVNFTMASMKLEDDFSRIDSHVQVFHEDKNAIDEKSKVDMAVNMWNADAMPRYNMELTPLLSIIESTDLKNSSAFKDLENKEEAHIIDFKEKNKTLLTKFGLKEVPTDVEKAKFRIQEYSALILNTTKSAIDSKDKTPFVSFSQYLQKEWNMKPEDLKSFIDTILAEIKDDQGLLHKQGGVGDLQFNRNAGYVRFFKALTVFPEFQTKKIASVEEANNPKLRYGGNYAGDAHQLAGQLKQSEQNFSLLSDYVNEKSANLSEREKLILKKPIIEGLEKMINNSKTGSVIVMGKNNENGVLVQKALALLNAYYGKNDGFGRASYESLNTYLQSQKFSLVVPYKTPIPNAVIALLITNISK